MGKGKYDSKKVHIQQESLQLWGDCQEKSNQELERKRASKHQEPPHTDVFRTDWHIGG